MNVTGRIALALLCCGGLVRAQERDSERVRHVYDVRVLTTQALDFRGPVLGRPTGAIDALDSVEAPEPIPGELLVLAIQTNFEEDSWSDERNSIEFSDGALSVTQTPAVHRLIASWLDTLRSRFARRVVVEADVIRVSAAAWHASGAVPGILTPAQETELRAAAADPARGSLLTVLRAVGLNGQRVYAADVRSQTYVRDLDVQIATSMSQLDPVTGKIKEGAVLDIRPRLAPDASHALIETRFSMSRLTALETFEPGGTAQGRLQLPVRDNLAAGTTVGCPIGRTLLLCAGTSATDGQVTAVLLRPSLSADGAAGTVKSTEKREMRFFDVANLTQQVPDFSSGFRLLSRGFQDGDAPALTFSSPELVGSTVEPEDLESWIRTNVEPRSWKNSRNRIEMWGTHFAVIQTPEVLDQIAAFLAAAVPNRSRMVSVESVLVAFDEAGWLARRASLSGANPAEADVAGVLESARRGDGCRVLGGTQVAAMNGERVHCWSGMDRDFVLDVDSEVTESASASDPVVGGIDGGFSLEVRPIMAGDQRTIRLELRPVWQDVSPPEVLDPQAAGVTPFQRLRTAEFRFDGLQFVGENTWTLAGTASRNSDGRREVMVLLVRARSMEVK